MLDPLPLFRRVALVSLACLSASASPLLAGAGSVLGTLELPLRADNRRIAVEKYTGKISGKVAPPPTARAGVWLTRPGLSAPASPPSVSLRQKNYQFGTSFLVVPVGTTVVFPNDDPDYHNVFSLSRAKRFDLGRYKKSETPAPEQRFDRAGLINLRCEIHEHMRARLLVVDSPYYAATDGAGRFRIEGVPEGRYTLHAQLDRDTKWRAEVTVVSGGSVTVKPVRGR